MKQNNGEMNMINSGAQNCNFTKRHISSENTTSERLSQRFGCESDSHHCVNEEFVGRFGIISAYNDILEPGHSVPFPLETNAKKTYTHLSCTHLVREKKVLNSPSISHCTGIEDYTLQEQQEEKLVDPNPKEGSIYLIEIIKERKRTKRR